MKFCDTCWAVLRSECDRLGLGQFIAPNAEEAQKRLADQRANGLTAANAEPLILATAMIYDAALQRGGVEIVVFASCPVCEAVKHGVGLPNETGTVWTEEAMRSHWTTEPLEAIRETFVEQGVLPRTVQ